jgi:hypothetical protein
MARWKLTEPHYLNCPDERWEHTAIDARTGKPVRKTFKVPKHLDPRVEDDWNHRPANNQMDGEIHICWPGKGKDGDITFEGQPTPGMFPLDDEAKAESAKYDWTPTKGTDEESQRASFYAKLGDRLVNHLTDMKADAASAPQAHGMEKFLEAMTMMMAQNQQMLALLAGKVSSNEDELTRQAKALGEKPPVYMEEPLPEAEVTEAELTESASIAAAKEVAEQKKTLNKMMSRRV